MNLLLAIGFIVIAVVLVRVWSGVMNIKTVESQSLAAVERSHPYLPAISTVLACMLVTGLFLFLSLQSDGSPLLRDIASSAAARRSIVVFLLIMAFGMFEQWRWKGEKDRYKYFFAFVLGTAVTWVIIGFKRALFETAAQQDPFIMALGVVCVVIGWKFLFGPWNSNVKATVLGTFVFWVSYAILRHKTQDELIATAIAAAMATVPAVIWCKLFLSYHSQRLSVVILAFFAGMLSTVPILFYSELMKRDVELNFFVVKIVPISFGTAAQDFASDTLLAGQGTIQAIVLGTLMTYLMVGVIEEISKYWVLKHSSARFFRSIDDAMQLAIVVAIGFAFAENLANPVYFIGFVRNFLLGPGGPQWTQFSANIVGRSVLTSMVHILSTGVLGYYVGLAYFASPLMRDQFAQGDRHPLIRWLHRTLQVSAETIYARYRLAQGLIASIALHGLFDFIVSLPEVLPGNPQTVGALMGLSAGSSLNSISITMLPAVLYVVGGCWLLVWLFSRKEDMKEFGAVVETQVYVN